MGNPLAVLHHPVISSNIWLYVSGDEARLIVGSAAAEATAQSNVPSYAGTLQVCLPW